MARSAYNYTLAETHKGKVYIPYVGIEVKGYTTLFSAVLKPTVTAVARFLCRFIFGVLTIARSFSSVCGCYRCDIQQ